jgi:hypothetical protein
MPGRTCKRFLKLEQYSNAIKNNTNLALKQLKAGTSTSTDMTQLILCAIFCNKCCGITTTDNDNGTILGGLDGRV